MGEYPIQANNFISADPYKNVSQIKLMVCAQKSEERDNQCQLNSAEATVSANPNAEDLICSIINSRKPEPIKRNKERTIEFALQIVNQWQALKQEGIVTEQG